MQFKTGDKVKLFGSAWYAGTVKSTAGPLINLGDGVGWRMSDSFELYESETYIVAVIEGGVPRPSSRPFIHDSRESAETEARRLAVKHTGQRFDTYKRVSSSSAPAPVASTIAA